MGRVIQGFTDYSTPCGQAPLSFIEMLANTIVGYVDEDGVNHYYINVIGNGDYCEDLTAFWNCNIQGVDPERALVENTFALDECGFLAWKLFFNYGAEQPQ